MNIISRDYVRLGDYNLTTEIDCMDGETKKDPSICAPEYQELGIMEYIPHPEYSSKKKTNDIGLVKLVQRAQYNGKSFKHGLHL